MPNAKSILKATAALAVAASAGGCVTMGERCVNNYLIASSVDQVCEQRVARSELATKSPDPLVRAGATIAQSEEDPALRQSLKRAARGDLPSVSNAPVVKPQGRTTVIRRPDGTLDVRLSY